MKIILGSQSPRRKQILEQVLKISGILTPHIDESHNPGETPVEYTQRITQNKLNYIIQQHEPWNSPVLIITSDTIVTIDDQILGKPTSEDDAVETLTLLSGKNHSVISGIAMRYISEAETKEIINNEITTVTFKNLAANDITAYLDAITYTDKAGSYALQEHGQMIIKKVEGSVTNVIGFPLRLFFRMLCEMGIENEVL